MINSEGKNILLDKLNRFISKYYKNRIIKGVMFLSATLLAFLILFSVVEYFSRFNSFFRTLIFWFYLAINSVIFIVYILLPILNLFRIGKVLHYEEAATIIGKHFPEIDDKILNILQLGKLNDKDNSLIEASILQKKNEISPFSFRSVIQFSENKSLLKWIAIPVIIILVFIFSGNKSIITESSARIIEYNSDFIPKAPFQFHINNENLSVLQYDDFNLDVSISGEKIPSSIFIELDGNRFSMQKSADTNFSFLLKNVVKNTEFQFFSSGFYSEFYTVESLLNPTILEFETTLNYPSYTKLSDEKIKNIGDFTVPEGTKINWNFNLKNTDSLFFEEEKSTKSLSVVNNKIQTNKSVFESFNYFLSTKNKNITSEKSTYFISVIKDEFPEISFEMKLDSTANQLFFNGEISDDYALSKLNFNYTVISGDSTFSIINSIEINKISKESFYHLLDINLLDLSPSDEITYYFEVWDNDAVNGNKSTKSQTEKIKEASEEQLQNKVEQEDEKIKGNLDNSIELAKEIQKDIENLKKDLINNKDLGWEQKKKMEDLLKKQKQLEDQIKKNNEKNKKNNNTKEKINSSILEKQRKLEELMNKVLDEESKALMEEMKKLLEEMDKKKMKEVLDKMENENSDLEKELDRNLELYKELEFEQKLEEIIDKIEELKEKQESLKKETQEKNSDSEKLSEKQEELQKELEKLKEDLKKLEEKNSELENKKDVPNTDQEKKKASDSMEESKKSLKKKQKKKSSKQQEETIEQLEEMSDKLKNLQTSESESKPMEDMETLRQILENLITLSFEQEELLLKISDVPKNSSSIVKYIQKQKKLSDDAQIIEDSLLALSKRVIQIESIINKEISSINFNMEKSITYLEERNIKMGTSKQQFVMTSVNNLALLLSETLKQMQMEMANKKPGSKQCNKPGSGKKPSLKELKKMQKKLNQQMKDQKGKNGKDGKKGEKKGEKQSNEGQNKGLMQLAKQQEQIRKRLQELRDEECTNGEKGNIDRILEKMEENETDILNNNITNETILRQEEILTRLLEAENSQREREEEEKRESIEWNFEVPNNNSDYLDYIQKKKEQEELLKTTPIQLNPFYKTKVNKYFNTISED
ncbi:MAG: hypothetical protein HOH88_03035 [Flavobacteriales bacterium]|nr:hypothetical protein [Flavobacteriales bacterium]